MVDKEVIDKVLALFDEEDIPYIHSELIVEEKENVAIEKPKVKTIGGKNDRPRK